LEEGFSGRTIIGTGIDEDVLIEAGIEQTDAFVSVTNGDNRNIMAAQVARERFSIRSIVCRSTTRSGQRRIARSATRPSARRPRSLTASSASSFPSPTELSEPCTSSSSAAGRSATT
jgi:hypothetical protein